jgi:hypothetical protein
MGDYSRVKEGGRVAVAASSAATPNALRNLVQHQSFLAHVALVDLKLFEKNTKVSYNDAESHIEVANLPRLPSAGPTTRLFLRPIDPSEALRKSSVCIDEGVAGADYASCGKSGFGILKRQSRQLLIGGNRGTLGEPERPHDMAGMKSIMAS